MPNLERIVIKIGSRVVTQSDGQLNHGAISALVVDAVRLKRADQDDKRVVIVSSGAVSCGRTSEELQGKFLVDEGNLNKATVREQVLAAVGQPELLSFYKNEF